MRLCDESVGESESRIPPYMTDSEGSLLIGSQYAVHSPLDALTSYKLIKLSEMSQSLLLCLQIPEIFENHRKQINTNNLLCYCAFIFQKFGDQLEILLNMNQ